MLTSAKFIQQSLELHLFFARIMKEHSFFLQIGFTPRDIKFSNKANEYRMEFDKLLGDAISLSNSSSNMIEELTVLGVLFERTKRSVLAIVDGSVLTHSGVWNAGDIITSFPHTDAMTLSTAAVAGASSASCVFMLSSWVSC